MGNPVKLAIDRQNGALIAIAGFAASMPVWAQNDVKDVIVQVYDPGSLGGPAIAVDFTGLILRMQFGTQPTGNTASTIVAGNTNMLWNPANQAVTGNLAGYFEGNIDFTQAALTTALGNNTVLPFYLQFDVRVNGANQNIWQTQSSITAVVDSAGGSSPAPNPVAFYTAAEADARYLRKDGGNNGDGYFMKSPGGTKRFFQLQDDGSLSPV